MVRLLGTFILLVSMPLNAAPWTLDKGFESGTYGAKAEGGSDSFDAAAAGSKFSCETYPEKLTGQCAEISILGGTDGWGYWGGTFDFPMSAVRGETIWYQVHTYMPSSFDYRVVSGSGVLKFLRIHTVTASGTHIGYHDLLFDAPESDSAFVWLYEGDPYLDRIGRKSDHPVKDKWEAYQMAVTLDNVSVDKGGMAQVRIWKNGVLLGKITNRITLVNSTDRARAAFLFTYWNSNAPKNQSMYVDEIRITTSEPTYKDVKCNTLIKPSVFLNPPKPPGPEADDYCFNDDN